jgi:glycosyltransferase involved in cell wall biosynthesis
MKLTAIIPTFNEEKNVEPVIQSVLFADEILIVDSFSTDLTLEIAKKYPVRIIQREYGNSASQKNWAIPQAKHEWILLVDADERVTPELELEIKSVLAQDPEESAFWIYRKNFFMGRHMKHSGLNTDKVIRLFRRDNCSYQPKNVHSEIVTSGKVGFLNEKFTHNTYISLDDYLIKKNRYAWWSAVDHLKRNTKVNLSQLFIKPTYRFFKHFVIQLGFLDRIPGLAYAFIESYGVFTRYLKIWLMQKGQFENHPDNKPKFILYLSYSYGIPILKPIEKVLKQQGFEVAWFLEMEDVSKHLNVDDVILKNTTEVLKYQPSVIFATSNEVPHFFPGIKVQVFHGFSVSKRSNSKGHFRIRGLFDLYCTQGPSTTIPFQKLEKKLGHFKIVETGWPKMDLLFPKHEKTNQKPTILFASTFTKSLSLAHNAEVFDEVKRLIQTQKYDWIFNLHPKMEAHIVQQFKTLAHDFQYPFIESYHNMDHLKKADLLLTDTSSIITEFILQEKPVVTFRNRVPQTHLIDVLEIRNLEKSIDFGLSKPPAVMDAIKKFNANEHPYTDGKSSERVVQAALNFHFNRDIVNLKPKPWNWIRKYQINQKFE